MLLVLIIQMNYLFNMDKYVGLPNFVYMTNFCDGRGYIISTTRYKGKIYGTITHKGETKRTKKYFDTCIDAQRYTASEMYLKLKN